MQQYPQQEPTVPLTVLRLSVLGPLLIECWDTESGTFLPLDLAKWHGKGRVPALSVLELLVSQPHRYASVDWISEQLWPAADPKAAKKRLGDVVSFLRGLLRPLIRDPETLVRHVGGSKGGGGGYQLAPYPAIWVDADAFLWHMHHAALYTQMEDDPQPYLEAAYELGIRGAYLMEEPYSDWAMARREEVAGAFRSCVHQLGHLYLDHGCLPLAEDFVRSYWATHMRDEDALRLLMNILGKQERWSEAYACYQQTCRLREQEGEAIDPRTHDLAEYWRTKPLSPTAKLVPQPSPVPPAQPSSLQAYENVIPFLQVIQALLPRTVSNGEVSSLSSASDTLLAQTTPLTYNASSQLSSLPRLGMPEMLMIQRRTFLYDLLNAASSSVIVSPYTLLSDESKERLELMMAHPSSVDDKAIEALASTLQNFWDLRQKIASIHLLGPIAEHLTTITQLLGDTRPTDISQRLCALASDNARLLGRIFDDIHEFGLAWKCYAFALKMAQEIHDNDLWAAGAVRLAELITKWGVPQHALLFLEEAHKRGIHDERLRVWLSAAEANIYAKTGNRKQFLRAWAQSKNITLPMSLAHDPYKTGFNPTMVAGYDAACFLWLREPERALLFLKDALTTHTTTRSRSLRLANLGKAHGQLGDVKKACELLLESLGITEQTKSLIALQRVYQGRAELEPWKESADVKELDARILEVYRSLAKVKERV